MRLVACCLIGLWAISCQAWAQVPASERPAVDELVRKSNAGAAEGGFCAGLQWPVGTGDAYWAWLGKATTGADKINKFRNGNCQYDRIEAVEMRDGRKCVRYTYFNCKAGAKCGVGKETECQTAAGRWERDSK